MIDLISIDQKLSIYNAILKEYTVEENLFDIKCLYNNQIIPGRIKSPELEHGEGITGYPLMILSYIPGGEIVGDIENGVSWKIIILSVDISAQNYDGRPSGQIINGQVLVDELSRQFINDVNDNWNDDSTLIEDNVRLQTPVDDPIDLSNITGTPHVYRNHIDINLIYKEV